MAVENHKMGDDVVGIDTVRVLLVRDVSDPPHWKSSVVKKAIAKRNSQRLEGMWRDLASRDVGYRLMYVVDRVERLVREVMRGSIEEVVVVEGHEV